MAYFDNAATTFPKPECVYSFMDEFYRSNGGSSGRGNYGLAISAKEIIDDTKNKIRNILHCPSKQVIFEPTATIALNIIIQGLIETGIKNVYITPFEHNAVTRTLHHFEQKKIITVQQLVVTKDLEYDLKRIKYQFDNVSPDLVIMSHASNVIGLISPVEEVLFIAKKYGAITLVDMAQTAGLVDVNVGLDTFDYAVFAGHKTLMGPTGISGFVMKPELNLPAVFFGGTGFESANQDMPISLPERFEMGTMNISGVAGLNAALQWISDIGVNQLRDREEQNRSRLLEILGQFSFIDIVGIKPTAEYVGIVSCLIDGISSDSAAGIFAERNIAVRTGLQCAPLAHQFLGTFPSGTIRFSVNALTTEEDFKQLIDALDDISNEL